MTSPVFYERLFYFNFCCVLCACWYFLRLRCIGPLRDAVRMGGLKERKQHQACPFSSFVASIISSFQFVHREEGSGGHLQILRIKMHNIFYFQCIKGQEQFCKVQTASRIETPATHAAFSKAATANTTSKITTVTQQLCKYLHTQHANKGKQTSLKNLHVLTPS